MNRVAIVGAGASGMIAAIIAARNGALVTLFEKKDRVGKKILVTGNGRCNFSNLELSSDFYYTEDDGFITKVFEKFDNHELITFFTGLGLLIREKNGYLYPACEQASAVLDVLRVGLKDKNIKVVTDCEVTKVSKTGNQFEVTLSDSGKEVFDKVIISTGGKSGLSKNESVNGYDLCKSLGLPVTKLYPALTQLKCEGMNFKAISGVRSECKLFLFANDELKMTQMGEVLFTDYGMSGIVSFQVSHYAAEFLDKKDDVKVVLDLLPGFDSENLEQFIVPKYLLYSDLTCEEFLTGILSKKLNVEFIKKAGMKPSDPVSNYSKEQIVKAVLGMKELVIKVTGTNGFDQSQVTGGGVKISAVSEYLESVDNKGLYVTGELLDVDGICGGYNLQWAFSTGAIAGEHAALN